MKIAVIGSGIAGASAAWLLSQRHEVTIFEQDDRPGGHTHTVEVPLAAGGTQPVDTGFIVYNERNYPQLTQLLRELEVPTRPADMTFAVSLDQGAYEYAGSSLGTLFAQLGTLASPRHWRMLADILRFNAAAKRAAANPAGIGDLGIDAWLDAGRYGTDFRRRYLLPMAGCIWSCSVADAAEFPARTFIEFYQRHGLLDIVGRPQWRHVVGGSQVYLRRLLERCSGQLRLGTGVTSIRRGPGGVWLRAGVTEEHFDAVVSAAHPDQLLACLEDADTDERAVLGAIGYSPNDAWLHTDTRLLPKRPAVWSSWNYLGSENGTGGKSGFDPAPICLSYWMNQLQHIPGAINYIVTLNPPRPPRPETVIRRMTYHHPRYTAEAVAAQQRLTTIQGRNGLWLCGAWTGYGFHEDGLRSAIEVAARFGCRPPWSAGSVVGTPKLTTASVREMAST